MTRTTVLLRTSTAAVLLLAIFALLDAGPPWLRFALATPLVALLPGYALMLAIRPDWHPGGIERFTIAIGTSLSLTMLVGLLLAVSPFGLSRVAWILALGTITLGANFVATGRSTDHEPFSLSNLRPRLTPLVVAALLVTGAAILGVQVVKDGETRAVRPDIVQLWMLPSPGAADGSVDIGVANVVSTTTRFNLRVLRGNTIESDTVLAVDVGRTKHVTLHPSSDTTPAPPVEAELVALDGNARPRKVSLWPTTR